MMRAMGEVIVITSGKGGVGKTTVTANIGTGLARLEKSVVIVDTDNGLRNLDILMGMESRIEYNLIDVLEGACHARQAMIRDKNLPNLYLLPAGMRDSGTAITPDQMKKLVWELKDEYDYCLVDCPAGIDTGFRNAISGADRAMIVTTAEVPAVHDAMRVVELLGEAGIDRIQLIVNKLRPELVRRRDMMSAEDVCEILGDKVTLIGQIPDDDELVIATNKGEPCVGDGSVSGRVFMNICRRILGEEVPFMDLMPRRGFLARLFGRR